jgi:hypothetical protein
MLSRPFGHEPVGWPVSRVWTLNSTDNLVTRNVHHDEPSRAFSCLPGIGAGWKGSAKLTSHGKRQIGAHCRHRTIDGRAARLKSASTPAAMSSQRGHIQARHWGARKVAVRLGRRGLLPFATSWRICAAVPGRPWAGAHAWRASTLCSVSCKGDSRVMCVGTAVNVVAGAVRAVQDRTAPSVDSRMHRRQRRPRQDPGDATAAGSTKPSQLGNMSRWPASMKQFRGADVSQGRCPCLASPHALTSCRNVRFVGGAKRTLFAWRATQVGCVLSTAWR